MTIQELYNALYISPYDTYQNLSGTAWDYSTGRLKTKTLTVNTAVTISNIVSGATWGFFVVYQDSSGAHTLSINGDSIPINAAPNSTTVVGFQHDGTRFIYPINPNPVLGAANDVTPPTVSSKVTGSTTTIVITMSENVTATNIGWSFKKNGSTYTPTGISGSGTGVLTFSFGSSMISTDVLLCSYNQGTGDCKDLSNNLLASFTDQSVTNNLGLIQLNAPVLSTPTVVGTTELDLAWTDTNSSPNESNFQLERSLNGTTGWSIVSSPAANATTYNDTGLPSSTQEFYRIKAVGNGTTTSDSAYSNMVNQTTGSGTVNLLLPANSGYTNTSQVFTVIGGGVAWGNTGIEDKYLPANTSGRIYQKYTATDAVDNFLGFVTINLGVKFATMPVCFRFTAATLETRETNALTSRGSVTIGKWYGLFRDGSTGAIKIQSSTDEITWTDIATLGYNSTAALYISSDINGGGKMYNPKGISIVAIPTVSGATGIDITYGTAVNLTNTSQVFTPTTNTGAYGNKGLDAKSLAINTTGRIFEKYTGGGDSFLGFSTANSNAGFAGVFAGFTISSTDRSILKTESGSSATVNADAGLNYYYSVFRDGSTGAFKIGRSADALNWMDTGITYTNNSTAQLFILCDLFGGASTKLDHPQGNSIA